MLKIEIEFQLWTKIY